MRFQAGKTLLWMISDFVITGLTDESDGTLLLWSHMIIIYRITASQKELILFWKQIHCGWSQAILAGIKRPCIDDVMLSCHADLSCCSVDCHYGVSLIQIAFLHGMSLLRTNIMYIPWGATSPPAGGILTVAVLSPPTVGPALNSSWITRWFMLQSHAEVGSRHGAEKYTNLFYMDIMKAKTLPGFAEAVYC